jgi:hypothetical protein
MGPVTTGVPLADGRPGTDALSQHRLLRPDRQMEPLITIAALGGFAVVMTLAHRAGRWILEPLSKESQLLNLPTRYSLSDFMWLLVMLQLALGVVVALVPRESRFTEFRTVLLTFLCGTAVVLWAFGVSSLSRAGVTRPLRRGVFTVFLLPAMVFFLMATGIGAVAAVVAFVAMFTDRSFVGVIASLGGAILWPLICWLLRKVAEWILSSSQHGGNQPDNGTER